MQQVTHTLVLFEKNRDGTPMIVGQKLISAAQYDELINDIFKNFMVGDIEWKIIKRYPFYKHDSLFVNFFIVIDAIRENEKENP